MAMEIMPATAPTGPELVALDNEEAGKAPRQASRLPAFALGAVIGAVAGATLGTLLSPHTRAYLVGLYQLVSRRLSSAERDKLRFELLLQ
ncbi:MAG: hypothetical protein KC442_06310 [Thermomicrobiales bacterium]|nr:hypothetical protein [Thermomicrobiales bacterium]